MNRSLGALALLISLGSGCGEPQLDGAPDGCVGECSDDGCVGSDVRYVACGIEDRGEQLQVCVDGRFVDHPETGCDDPTECGEDGDTPETYEGLFGQVTPCGLNDRGWLALVCVDGRWEDRAEECLDPDECEDGDARETECGLNGRGLRPATCDAGAWVEHECVDPDECEDGALREPAPCGKSNTGELSGHCESGAWVDTCTFSNHADLYDELGRVHHVQAYHSETHEHSLVRTVGNAFYEDGANIGDRSGRLTVSFWIDRVSQNGPPAPSYVSLAYFNQGWDVDAEPQDQVKAVCAGDADEQAVCRIRALDGLYPNEFTSDQLGGGFHHVVLVMRFGTFGPIRVTTYIDGELDGTFEHNEQFAHITLPNRLVFGRSTVAEYTNIVTFPRLLDEEDVATIYEFGP